MHSEFNGWYVDNEQTKQQVCLLKMMITSLFSTWYTSNRPTW